MLATIVLDAYREDETNDLKDCLEEHFNAKNNSDWSSAGIYCYWDYYTREILYFGLAVDLFERFKQHNGLPKANLPGSKYKEIKEYFTKKEKLGFSIMIQSPFSQPFTSKLKRKYRNVWELNPDEIEEIGSDGRSSVQVMEGILLNSFMLQNGQYPKWNNMGGSLIGQLRTKPEDWELAQRFTDIRPNSNNSRSSLRELHANNLFNLYESHLHAVRISPMPIEMHVKLAEIEGFSILDEIQKSDYLKKELKI